MPTTTDHAARSRRRRAALALCLAGSLLLVACANVPTAERLLSPQSNSQVAVSSQPCAPGRVVKMALRPGPEVGVGPALDGNALRILSWNLHKGEDAGWDVDLGRYAAAHDLLLLQEAVLMPPLQALLERSGHGWHMAGAFSFADVERGVMTAARVPALDGSVT